MRARLHICWVMIFAFGCSGTTDHLADKTDSVTTEELHQFESRWVNSRIPLQEILDSLKIPVETLRIVVTKSEYQLSVYSNSIFLKSYPVVFGPNPEDDKLKRGDGCTPEGIFKVKSKYPHKSWSKFIWIDYPNADSWRKHKKAKAEGLIPPKADVGGNIGIHGVPKGGDYAIDYMQNWTLGCISMKNKDVDELYPFIHSSIEIEIKK